MGTHHKEAVRWRNSEPLCSKEERLNILGVSNCTVNAEGQTAAGGDVFIRLDVRCKDYNYSKEPLIRLQG